jgi:hypothetical protein
MIVIDNWGGLVTNASPYVIKPGAAVTQVNLQVLIPGQLSVRPGTTALSFSTHSGSTSPVIGIFRRPGTSETIVYQNAAGEIRAGTL